MPTKTTPQTDVSPVETTIQAIGGWRAQTLNQIRFLIHKAEPNVVEEIKWRKPSNPHGVPVWSSNGIICTGEAYKDKVKITFMQGASLNDPARLFNAPGTGQTRRAIDIHQNDALDEKAFTDLVRQAIKNKTD